jgi:hypothetical protein
VNEKKILRKNERIAHLEKQLIAAREKLGSYKLRLGTMESELCGLKNFTSMNAGRLGMNIRKKIVGGRKKVVPNYPFTESNCKA